MNATSQNQKYYLPAYIRSPILFLIFIVSFTLFASGCSTLSQNSQAQKISMQRTAKPVVEVRIPTAEEQKWGIEVVSLRTTMAGMMVHFRYKVVDPIKAAPLLDLKKKSYLLVEENGAKLGVPNSVKVGALRQTTHPDKVIKGKDYFVMFGNPRGRYAKPGDKVSVVIGDMKLAHMTLQ